MRSRKGVVVSRSWSHGFLVSSAMFDSIASRHGRRIPSTFVSFPPSLLGHSPSSCRPFLFCFIHFHVIVLGHWPIPVTTAAALQVSSVAARVAVPLLTMAVSAPSLQSRFQALLLSMSLECIEGG